MPVLNGDPEHLKLSIESILQQSMIDFEFIIIDDCSNQETKQLLSSYCAQDVRIRIITSL
jgi:teichuronic acid biosynthesis glycosyltransferase TuaG